MPPPSITSASDAQRALRDVLGASTLPSFPRRHQKILEELRKERSTSAHIVEAIAMDPSVSVRVLRLANSAAFGIRSPIDSIHQAVVRLGRARLEVLVIGLGTARAVARHRRGPLDHKRFWAAATRRASIARRLAEKVLPSKADQTFTAALISDIAVPILSSTRPRIYADLFRTIQHEAVPLEQIERETFGWSHETVVGWLTAAWDLPHPLIELVASHHQTPSKDRPKHSTVQSAALATGSLGVETDASDREGQAISVCWHQLGIPPEHAKRVLSDQVDATDPLVTVFTQPSSRPYQSSSSSRR